MPTLPIYFRKRFGACCLRYCLLFTSCGISCWLSRVVGVCACLHLLFFSQHHIHFALSALPHSCTAHFLFHAAALFASLLARPGWTCASRGYLVDAGATPFHGEPTVAPTVLPLAVNRDDEIGRDLSRFWRHSTDAASVVNGTDSELVSLATTATDVGISCESPNNSTVLEGRADNNDSNSSMTVTSAAAVTVK